MTSLTSKKSLFGLRQKRAIDPRGAFGVNKQQQINRLLYEISKRESLPLAQVAAQCRRNNFHAFKEALLRRRYPHTFSSARMSQFFLPRYQPRNDLAVQRRKNPEIKAPHQVYIEAGAQNCALAKRCKELFPKAAVYIIPSLKVYLCEKRFDLKDYTQRGQRFFLVKEQYDFSKHCPCTQGAYCCGYQVVNLGFGCIYECAYCFLQEYQNVPGIVLPVNPEDFFATLKIPRGTRSILPYYRLGSGEFTDSLVFDELTGYSRIIMEAMKKYPKVYFEFKTKSAHVSNIITAHPQENIIVSWSLNPQKLIDENEWYTATLKQRLQAAQSCVRRGFKVGFHFDPLIYYASWEKEYQGVVELLFDTIPGKAIAWISLGTLRFSPTLKKLIEQRFPRNTLLDEELLLGFDGKMRYHDTIRVKMYNTIAGMIRKRSRDTFLYLCMEPKAIWEQVQLSAFCG